MSHVLSYRDIPPEIKKIARDTIGSGVLRATLGYPYTYNLVMRIIEGELVGFALYHVESEGRKNVGVIDHVCVDPEFQGQGHGTLLLYSAVRKLSLESVVELEMPVRVKEKTRYKSVLPAKVMKLLEGMGFVLRSCDRDYYVGVSKKYGYQCSTCQQKPDSCSRALFVLE